MTTDAFEADDYHARRETLVADVAEALRQCCAHSRVERRGSLAAGTSDRYGDTDLCLVVPDEAFATAVEHLGGELDRGHPVADVRSVPEFRRSDKRCLVFVSFRDLPLFWRLNLEVWAASVAGEDTYDADNPDARGEGCSPTASALANGLAAVKAVQAISRVQPEWARTLLDPAFRRIGDTRRAIGDWSTDIAAGRGHRNPASPVARLGQQVTELSSRLLGPPSNRH